MSDLWKTGLGLIWVEMLYDAGYHCLADLAAATDEALLAIPGIGHFKLRAIRRAAPFVPLTTGPRVATPYRADAGPGRQVEELPDDLQSLSDKEESGHQHEVG